MTDDPDATAASSDADWLIPHLADLASPGMPAEVADHLRNTIQAEAALRSSAATAVPASSLPPPAVADLAAERRARRASRTWWAAAVGIVAVGLAGLVYVETMPSASDSGSVTAESTVGRTDPQPAVVPVTSGADYSVQNISTMVPAAITSARSAAPTDALRATFAETEAGIRSCLAGVGEPPQDLALLDMARFQNAPVAVLAYLDGNDDGTADVVIVGVRCSQEDPQVRHRDVANMVAGSPVQPE
jgi:hypothetical protein